MPYMVILDENGAIPLPDKLIQELGWIEGDELDMTVENGKIIVRRIAPIPFPSD